MVDFKPVPLTDAFSDRPALIEKLRQLLALGNQPQVEDLFIDEPAVGETDDLIALSNAKDVKEKKKYVPEIVYVMVRRQNRDYGFERSFLAKLPTSITTALFHACNDIFIELLPLYFPDAAKKAGAKDPKKG